MVYTQYKTADAAGRAHGLGSRCKIPYSPERLLVDFMTFHFRLVRRGVFDQAGGFDPAFDRAEDYDLCLRISEITEVRRIERPLYYYRVHRGGESVEYQVEQINHAKRAVLNAVERRGLHRTHELSVYLESRFVLSRRRDES